MQDTFKKGFGDRYDGWRVRHVDAVYNVIPFVMRTRLDAQNLFEENIPIENIERFIRDHREDMPGLAFMHVIIAAMVRMIATRPYLNRFVMWNKIYARNHIDIALMIKRKHSNVETNVKPEFEPTATHEHYERHSQREHQRQRQQQYGQVCRCFGLYSCFYFKVRYRQPQVA